MGAFLFEVVLFVVLGAVLSVVDEFYGVGLRKKFLGKKRSAAEQGFISTEMFGTRLYVVGALMAAWLIIGFLLHVGVLELMFDATIGLLALTSGTYLGPIFSKLLGKGKESVQRIEGFERRVKSGETTLGGEVAGAARSVRDRFMGDEAAVSQPTATSTAKQPPADPTEPDPQKAFDKFTKGRG